MAGLGLMAGMVFIWLTMLFGSGRTIDGGSLERGWDNTNRNGTPKEGAVYVDLADLEGAADTDFWGSRTKFQELCPRMYFTRQLSMGPEERTRSREIPCRCAPPWRPLTTGC